MPALVDEKMATASDDSSVKPTTVNTNSNTATTKDKNKAKAGGRGRAQNMLSYTQRQVDRVVSPSTRQRVIDKTTAFAAKRPLLFLFITAQILTALIPFLLFATFILSATALALFCAVAFALFWNGVALLVLIPTLFLTFGLSVLLWLWAVGTYIVFRAIYSRLPAGARGNANTGEDNHRVIYPNGASVAGFDHAVDAEAREARE